MWDYDKIEYDKQAAADPIWRLERLINYGLGDEKIDKKLLKKFLPKLRISDNRRNFLELLLWNKRF